jgi:hypothetical protein
MAQDHGYLLTPFEPIDGPRNRRNLAVGKGEQAQPESLK